MATGRRQGRFTAMHHRELFETIAEIAKLARPDDPAATTQRQFNQAREHPAAPPCPTANAIYMRLRDAAPVRVSWRSIVQAACDDGRDNTQTLVAFTRSPPANHLTGRHIAYAVRRVAFELEQATVTRDEYIEARARLVTPRRGRARHTRLLLPTVTQVERAAVGLTDHASTEDASTAWEIVLGIAGLATPVRQSSGRPDWLPPNIPGLPIPEVIAAFTQTNAWLPSSKEIYAFVRACDVIMQDKQNGKSWDSYLDDAVALLRERDLPVPTDRTGRGRPTKGNERRFRVPPDGIPGAPRRSERKARKVIDEERCIQGLCAWLSDPDRADQKESRDAYRLWSKGTGHPSPSRFPNFGGFTELRRLARERLAEDEGSGAGDRGTRG